MKIGIAGIQCFWNQKVQSFIDFIRHLEIFEFLRYGGFVFAEAWILIWFCRLFSLYNIISADFNCLWVIKVLVLLAAELARKSGYMWWAGVYKTFPQCKRFLKKRHRPWNLVESWNQTVQNRDFCDFLYFRKIFKNLRKCSEIIISFVDLIGSVRKSSLALWTWSELFRNIFRSWKVSELILTIP